jgi:dihydroorotase
LGYPAGLAIGAVADLCVVDTEMMWTVNENNLNSTSRYTPFSGMYMPGVILTTVKAGRIVWERA